MIVSALAALLLAAPTHPVLKPCVVQGVGARCTTVYVPENRSVRVSRAIGLRVVVLPALNKPARRDAFTYIAGGPGTAAASETVNAVATIWFGVRDRHDIVLVDQRGTGGSNRLACEDAPACLSSLPTDPRLYGTRTAMDDLDAVRAALGYRQLDVYGTSYGATAAQVFLNRHPTSVRTMVLDGATALDVPFYSRYAANVERSIDLLAGRCTADPACRHAYPHWRPALSALIRAWNEHPVENRRDEHTTGSGLAGVVEGMLTDASRAAAIPMLVAHAAKGNYDVLNLQIHGTGNGPPAAQQQLMFWSIWCNEPWVGLGAKGPWGTDFDGLAKVTLDGYRDGCAHVQPKRTERASDWRFPRSNVPVLVLAGGSDPQDPVGNLPHLRRNLPNSRAVVVPGLGHAIGQYGCLGSLVADFVDRGSARGLDTSCISAILPPPFVIG